jgi:hypothetical protein
VRVTPAGQLRRRGDVRRVLRPDPAGEVNDMADKPIPKGDIPKWLKTLAKNDAKHGRDSKNNPNNKPNGK